MQATKEHNLRIRRDDTLTRYTAVYETLKKSSYVSFGINTNDTDTEKRTHSSRTDAQPYAHKQAGTPALTLLFPSPPPVAFLPRGGAAGSSPESSALDRIRSKTITPKASSIPATEAKRAG